MTTVRWPRNARPAATAAALVVLPTPPLPDVSTMTFAAKKTSPSPGRPALAAPIDRAGAAGGCSGGLPDDPARQSPPANLSVNFG